MIEFLEDTHYFYQVTAFMNYRTLDDLMKKQSIEYITESQILPMLMSIVSALNQVHRTGFIHNDI